MSAGMTKPWIDATSEAIIEIPVTTGVYEIRDKSGELLDIGYAGSREPFGLRSLLQRLVGEIETDGLQFRYEQHVQYHTRYIELVLNHRARHDGVLPQRVAERRPLVHGHLSP